MCSLLAAYSLTFHLKQPVVPAGCHWTHWRFHQLDWLHNAMEAREHESSVHSANAYNVLYRLALVNTFVFISLLYRSSKCLTSVSGNFCKSIFKYYSMKNVRNSQQTTIWLLDLHPSVFSHHWRDREQQGDWAWLSALHGSLSTCAREKCGRNIAVCHKWLASTESSHCS